VKPRGHSVLSLRRHVDETVGIHLSVSQEVAGTKHHDVCQDRPAARVGIGNSIRRVEDEKLVRGGGRYTDDVNLHGQAHAAFLRSRVAHGLISKIDVERARSMPGVIGVFTAADISPMGGITAWIPPGQKNQDGKLLTAPVRPPLARDRVRYVGEPVVLVVADSPIQAKDAMEAVTVEIEPLQVVASVAEAMKANAPLIHEEYEGNVAFDFSVGNNQAVETAFATADHVTRLYLSHNRVVANPIEPRSAIASYDASADQWTIYIVSQGVLRHQNMIASDVLNCPPDKVRVITDNVGGSFGLKGALFVEYPCIMAAARHLGRPVKWTDERSGSFLSDNHSRGQEGTVELALDKKGRFLAYRFDGIADAGAYLAMARPMINAALHTPGVYRTPAAHFSIKMIYTNTVPMASLRGAGRPEGTYFMERVIDAAAYEMGMDPIELRRRNFISADQMPYTNVLGTTYDCGDFGAVLDAALETADIRKFKARRRESEKSGKRRGLGVSIFIEITGPGDGELGGIRFERDGSVTMISGTLDHGQGHGTCFGQVLADKLGIPFADINLHQRDSAEIRIGGSTGGSRSAVSGGSALVESSELVIKRGRKLAAHFLEASEQDIRFADGLFTIGGTDRSIGLLDIAQRLHAGTAIPANLPRSLDVHKISVGNYPSTYPNGCHIAEVEIDVETGETRLVKYTSVDDFGVLLNPMIVEGQVHGGIMMGLGQVLMEHAMFDDEGQLLTGSFMDYAMPRAADAPFFKTESLSVPTKTNPLGVKGCGEAGVSGVLAAVMNAVDDALRPLGVPSLNMPVSSARVWEAIQHAKRVGINVSLSG
jgi:carbon-monoxide dehydrogenase large subunit